MKSAWGPGGIGEKLLLLAFATWTPSEKLTERQLSVKALRLDAKEVQRKPTVPRYLSALRAAMSTSPEVLCESLESKLLPRAWAAEPSKPWKLRFVDGIRSRGGRFRAEKGSREGKCLR